jgi:integrase/recombinase XerD
MAGATRTKRGVICSSCRSELEDGACPTHGERNADGSSPHATANRGRRFGPERLSEEQVQSILAQCGSSLTGIRNKAMIATMWRTGVRSAELLALRPKDVDKAAGHLVVQRGKGDKQRTVGIDADALTLIERWMEARRREREISAHRPLFCSLNGTTLPTSYLRELLPRLAAKAGLKRRISPHMLRHSLAFDLMMEDTPLIEISAQPGRAGCRSSAATRRRESWPPTRPARPAREPSPC